MNCIFIAIMVFLIPCAAWAQDTKPQRFTESTVWGDIDSSKHDIEIRVIFKTTNLIGSAVVIKGNAKNLTGETLYYSEFGIAQKSLKPIKRKDGTIYFGNIPYQAKTFAVSDTLLSSLIKNHLYDLPDTKIVRDSLIRTGQKYNDSFTLDTYGVLFELKVNGQIRRFYADPFLYNENSHVVEFHYAKKLCDEFEKIYRESGQPRNHLLM